MLLKMGFDSISMAINVHEEICDQHESRRIPPQGKPFCSISICHSLSNRDDSAGRSHPNSPSAVSFVFSLSKRDGVGRSHPNSPSTALFIFSLSKRDLDFLPSGKTGARSALLLVIGNQGNNHVDSIFFSFEEMNIGKKGGVIAAAK